MLYKVTFASIQTHIQHHLCLPWHVQANCRNVAAARLMSKQSTPNSGYKDWFRAYFIAVWYARQAIPKQKKPYVLNNTSKCNLGMIPPNRTKYDQNIRIQANQVHMVVESNKLNKQRWRTKEMTKALALESSDVKLRRVDVIYCITLYFRGRKISRKVNLKYFREKIFSRIFCSPENIFPRKYPLVKISAIII